ncbi:MAG TPA: hypothetical protein V6C57_21050 [Coleofasciculaceae cyanobacterium]
MSKRIITDMPNLVGWKDGFNAVSNGDRTSRVDQLPADQQQAYLDNFKRGARDSAKTES